MPRKPVNEQVRCTFFRWLLGQRDAVFYADGRGNDPHDLGRHSLGTRDRSEALTALSKLDLVKAVELGLAPKSSLQPDGPELLPLDEGVQLYRQFVQRPPVRGGAEPSTWKRYRAVFDKFLTYAKGEGVPHWNSVTRHTLDGYAAWLDDNDYESATEYLELTTIKQAMKWMAQEELIPTSCLFHFPLEKPTGTTTYCYTRDEVQAIVDHCAADEKLKWLGNVVIGLATTGLRISELAELRWTDLDMNANMIRLTDDRRRATKSERAKARSLKTHKVRMLPMAINFKDTLIRMSRDPDGIFHGPFGGLLKPDTVRNVLIRDVLAPLSKKFPAGHGQHGLEHGRLHSFRHYFCSVCARDGVPEQELMAWLGHQDSKMIRHYYHLHSRESQKHMKAVKFLDGPSGDAGGEQSKAS